VREDKRKWMTEKAQAAQTAAENGRAKGLYDNTRQPSSRGPRKTEAITKKDGKLLRLRVRDSMVEEVDSFTYLGAQVTKDGGATLGINKRTVLLYASFNRLNKIWRAKHISRKTKATLFKTLVLPVLLCGCETWKMTKGEEKKLDILQTKCLTRIFCIRWQQHVPNKEVLEKARADPRSEEVRRKRWCWIAHVLRKEVKNACAVALGWKPEGKKSRGRPKTTYLASHCREGDRQVYKDGTHE